MKVTGYLFRESNSAIFILHLCLFRVKVLKKRVTSLWANTFFYEQTLFGNSLIVKERKQEVSKGNIISVIFNNLLNPPPPILIIMFTRKLKRMNL